MSFGQKYGDMPMKKNGFPIALTGLACVLCAVGSLAGDLSADAVSAEGAATLEIGPDVVAPGAVHVVTNMDLGGSLSAAGAVFLYGGVPYLRPLGDVPMGNFTNMPGGVVSLSNAPAWWAARGVTGPGEACDYAAAVQGQVKWIAQQAAGEFGNLLGAAGGAGVPVSDLVASFSLTNNALPVTLGQLKNVAKPFYDRLMEVGVATNYPWISGTPSDFALANVGQVKFLFSFDFDRDTDGDGMPDGWEAVHAGFDPLVAQTDSVHGMNDDPDGDGLSNLDESLLGTDPSLPDTDYDGLSDKWEADNGLNPLSGLSGGLSENLVGWWQFREGQGTNSADLSGCGNTAYILFTNQVQWVPDAPVGSALSFSPSITGIVTGTNGGFVVVPGLASVPLTNGFTVAAWVKADTYPSYATIVTKSSEHDDWTDGLSLYYDDITGALSLYAGNWDNGENYISSDISTTGAWLHVCGVYDGANASLYINGVLCEVATNSYGSVACNDPLWIGSTFKNGVWLWDGEIADVRVYVSALSTNDILSLLEFASDSDGDGLTNLREYQRDTDPQDPASVNCILYVDSDVGSSSYDGCSQEVLSSGRGPKATVQQALDLAVSGDVIELRGSASFGDTVLSPGAKSVVLRPVGAVRF